MITDDDGSSKDHTWDDGKNGHYPEICVIAVQDSKLYDGNHCSVLSPKVVGNLADDHLAIATQKYLRRDIGETVIVPEITVVDRHGKPVEYRVKIQHAVGMIKPRPITVWAATATKEYDGTVISLALPVVDDWAHGDTVHVAQEYDTPDVGVGKTLTPSIKIDDSNDGKNYEPVLVPVHTGTIMEPKSPMKPRGLKAVVDKLGTDDFKLMKLGSFADFIGEICHIEGKTIYLKLLAKKRIQMIIELELIDLDFERAIRARRLHVRMRNNKLEVQAVDAPNVLQSHHRRGQYR